MLICKDVAHFPRVARIGSGAADVVIPGCFASSSCSCDIGKDVLTRSNWVVFNENEEEALCATPQNKTANDY